MIATGSAVTSLVLVQVNFEEESEIFLLGYCPKKKGKGKDLLLGIVNP